MPFLSIQGVHESRGFRGFGLMDCLSRFSAFCGVSKPEVKNAETGEFVLDRETPPGVYQYKFIVDGEWFLGGNLAGANGREL